MIVAVASGKGGTGKTTVTASLVSVWDRPVAAVDLDVEEPNLHLFLHPDLGHEESVYMEVPEADEDKCTYCRACAEICQFKAIAVMGETLLTFPEMCHGCGGCLAVCPEGALSPGRRVLGTLQQGSAGEAGYLMGRLRVGEAMSPPLMRAVKARLRDTLEQTPRDRRPDAVLDAPPGVSCPAVNAVMDCDCALLVTEPTPFGFHDFCLAWEAFQPLGPPMGAVINRAGLGDDSVQRFCKDKGIPVLAEIPYDPAIAKAYSLGRLVAEVSPELRGRFENLRDATRALAAGKLEAAHV
jgi:MinD superfamily P-loop ATPase